MTLGPDRDKEALRSGWPWGPTGPSLLDAAWDGADTLTTARAIAALLKQEAPGLALFGRQAIDDDMGAVAAQVAELLGWPCASWIMEEAVDAGATSVRVARQVEGGLEVFDLPLPAVVSAQKGLNEPRYPTLKGIMGAKKKEIKDVKGADLWVYGAAGEEGTPMWSADLSGGAAFVFGAEGRGLRPLVRRTCDALVSIPLAGKVESLNVSVAAGILLYEARRQRGA